MKKLSLILVALFALTVVAQDEKALLPDREITIGTRADSTTGELTGSSPTYDRIFTGEVDPGCNAASTFSGTGVGVHYAAYEIYTTSTEPIIAEVNAGGTTLGDTVLSLYCAPFDPSDASANLVAYDDDGGTGLYSAFDGSEGATMTANTSYYLVLATFGPGDTGAYQLDVGGNIQFGAPCTIDNIYLSGNTLHMSGVCADMDLYAYTATGGYVQILSGFNLDGSHSLDVSAYRDSFFVAVAGGGDPAVDGVMTVGATVPTLGEWGLIAFLSLFAMAGLVLVRRQRTA